MSRGVVPRIEDLIRLVKSGLQATRGKPHTKATIDNKNGDCHEDALNGTREMTRYNWPRRYRSPKHLIVGFKINEPV